MEDHGIFPVNITDLSRIFLELLHFTEEQNNEMTENIFLDIYWNK